MTVAGAPYGSTTKGDESARRSRRPKCDSTAAPAAEPAKGAAWTVPAATMAAKVAAVKLSRAAGADPARWAAREAAVAGRASGGKPASVEVSCRMGAAATTIAGAVGAAATDPAPRAPMGPGGDV